MCIACLSDQHHTVHSHSHSLNPTSRAYNYSLFLLQTDSSYGVMDSIHGAAGLDGGKHHAFVIVYRPDDRVSALWRDTYISKLDITCTCSVHMCYM